MTLLPVLILDSRDSFVFNLDQAFRSLGASDVLTRVVRTDRTTASEVLDTGPAALVLSPGPGRPEESGCLLDVVRHAPPQLPILGVCLGHHALAAAAGAEILRADQVFHGRCSWVRHDNSELFDGIENPFLACRYHSLVIDDLPPDYEAAAWSDDGTLMAMRHRHLPRYGLQFHPESFRTPVGADILSRFLQIITRRSAA